MPKYWEMNAGGQGKMRIGSGPGGGKGGWRLGGYRRAKNGDWFLWLRTKRATAQGRAGYSRGVQRVKIESSCHNGKNRVNRALPADEAATGGARLATRGRKHECAFQRKPRRPVIRESGNRGFWE